MPSTSSLVIILRAGCTIHLAEEFIQRALRVGAALSAPSNYMRKKLFFSSLEKKNYST